MPQRRVLLLRLGRHLPAASARPPFVGEEGARRGLDASEWVAAVRLFRLLLSDGTTWAVTGRDVPEARRKAERYFPNEHVQVEESVDGAPWKLVDAGCGTCPAGDVMPDLGSACEVSCGRQK